jgi:RimJ/RimL family protein N-acetyltransferase
MKSDILIRDVSESDLPIFYEQQLDPVATQMAAFPSRDRDAFMAHWKNKVLNNETGVVKTILFENQVAGNIVSWEQGGQREVGYWLGREYWGKGIATQALIEFLGIVKTRPLVAHVAKHNTASLRVLQKCGFQISSEDKFTDENNMSIEEIILELKA